MFSQETTTIAKGVFHFARDSQFPAPLSAEPMLAFTFWVEEGVSPFQQGQKFVDVCRPYTAPHMDSLCGLKNGGMIIDVHFMGIQCDASRQEIDGCCFKKRLLFIRPDFASKGDRVEPDGLLLLAQWAPGK